MLINSAVLTNVYHLCNDNQSPLRHCLAIQTYCNSLLSKTNSDYDIGPVYMSQPAKKLVNRVPMNMSNLLPLS